MVLRSRPSTSDESVIFEERFQAGQLLFVIDGPAEGSGYTWYLIQDTPGWVERADGWVAAAARDGTPWLATASVPCPPEPSLEDLAALDQMQRIHCYDAREFTFTSSLTGGVMCGAGVVLKSPAWMAGCASTFWWGRTNSGLIVAIPPELSAVVPAAEPDVSFQATVTAHMDDPVARTCVPWGFEETDYDLLNPGTVLACRSMFVATSVEITP